MEGERGDLALIRQRSARRGLHSDCRQRGRQGRIQALIIGRELEKGGSRLGLQAEK